jgi:hypothetical protein
MDGKLEKLKIESYTDPKYQRSPTQTFTVSFNPATYSVKYVVEYDEKDQGRGTTGMPQRYKRNKPGEFSLEFVLDGTGASADKEDVEERIDEFLTVVHNLDGEIHRPRYLRVAWGTLLFDCVFKDVNIKYTLFDPNGRPVRANLTAVFASFVNDDKRDKQEGKKSPDLTRVHFVRKGETLPLLAHQYYGDPRYYLALARHNQLNNFRELQEDRRIEIPPLAKA